MQLATRTLDGSLTREQLEHALAHDERALGTLCKLQDEGVGTIATYDSSRPPSAGRLIVQVRAPGVHPPPFADPVLSGRAFVDGRLEPVTVFRRKPGIGNLEADRKLYSKTLPSGEIDFGFITGPSKR